MAQDKIPPRADVAPDQRKLTSIQAKRLAAASGIEAERLVRYSVAELRDKLQWQIDPSLLLFRRICGRVVQRDPVTGVEYPVPNATVYVEDTDCDLLAFHPSGWRFSWYFPFRCRREVIATVRTDACGRFCAWIPAWDIDWIVRWRHARLCFRDIFVRPTIRDVIDERVPPRVRPRPGPGPDPESIFRTGTLTRSQLETLVGPSRADRLTRAAMQTSFGADTSATHALLDAPAFDTRVPPPLPHDLRIVDEHSATHAYEQRDATLAAMGTEAVHATLAAATQTSVGALQGLDLRRYVGPFRRCFDVWLPQWTRIVDVPDITFRVTQDVNGDGVEETIYSEGHFEVRWDAGALPDVTLEASPIALATHACGVVPVPCGNTPAITAVGLMPLDQTVSPRFYDITSGYGLRTNRPHPSGELVESLPLPAASSPLCDTLQLYGCLRTNPAATQYRLRYRYSPDGVTFSAPVDFRESWPIHRVLGGVFSTVTQAPDAAGWYPIPARLTAPDFYPVPAEEFMLLEWATTRFADGIYQVTLELGSGDVMTDPSPATWTFRIDNASPVPSWTIEWRTVGAGGPSAWTPVAFPCPVIYRGVITRDVEFRVRATVSATHLRSAQVSGSGCGAGTFETLLPPTIGPDPRLADRWSLPHLTGHWYVNAADTSVTLASLYRLASTASQGTYGFHFEAVSRAFNPSAGDGGHLVDYFYDPVYRWTPIDIAFSVIDADPPA